MGQFQARVYELREKQLLAVAERMLATQGCERFSTEEVAKRVGVGKGTVYSHYPSQRALIDAVLSRASGQLLIQLQNGVASDAGARLALAVSGIAGQMAACPKGSLRYPCCLRSAPCPMEGGRDVERFLQGLIEDCARAGLLRQPIDSGLAARTLQHLLSAAANLEELRAVSQLFLGGLLRPQTRSVGQVSDPA
ncbi:MAG: TetR/AcrR family transcriptional regulator [Acidobacteria bacterium]|nr:TetR/AcrR family transcriptional regulator [Acidobacteriota bacterium]